MTNKIVYLFSVLCLSSFVLTSCLDDSSTAWNQEAGDIIISGIENSYTATAFTGEHLRISPSVETGYADDNMSYVWMLVNDKTGKQNAKGETIAPDTIGTTKNLDYEVATAPGVYQLRLYAKAKSNNYTAVAYTTLTVQTDFSQGFYILKETVDGNTEIDLLNTHDELLENRLAEVSRVTLKGKPLMLSPCYNAKYVNPDDDEMSTANMLGISTESGDFCVVRTTDLAQVFNRENIGFEGLAKDEKVYGYLAVYGGSMMITSNGVYVSNSGTGQFGVPDIESSPSPCYFADVYSSGGGTFWDSKTHSLTGFNFNMIATPVSAKDGSGEDLTQNLANFDCMYSGYNYMQWYSPPTGVFIMRDNSTQERYIYLTTSSFRSQFLVSRTKLNPNSHMAKASYYAINGMTASYVYCLDGGKIYACVINDADLPETEIRPEGLPDNEEVVYVADQFWNESTSKPKFEYLIVGTQTGNTYKLYFYETVGGAPTGKPVKVVQGTGRLKRVRYLNSSFNSNFLSFYIMCYNACD